MFTFLLDGEASAQAGNGGMITYIIYIVLFAVVIGWFFLSNRKKDKEQKKKLSELRVGDKVVTIGGLIGLVANIKDDEITISTSMANTLVTFQRNAISTVVPRDSETNK